MLSKIISRILVIGIFMSCPVLGTETAKDTLIPRSILFSDPKYAQVKISPDGKHLAYLAPHNGVLNVWVGNANDIKSMHPITENKTRGLAGYFWAYNNEHILYIDDDKGNENWRIYRVNVKTGETMTLADFNKVQVQILATSKEFPDEILIGLNKRSPEFHDVYRLNVRTGKLTLQYENNSFSDFTFDKALNVRLGMETTPDGGAILYTLNKDYSKKELFKIGSDDLLTTSPLFLDKTATILYLLDSRGRNTSALFALDLKSNKSNLLGENKKADISNVLIHPTERTIQGYASNYEKEHWTILDKSIQSDINYLKQLAPGELEIISRSIDDKTWIAAYLKDNGAPHYYLYDRTKHKAHFLFSSKPQLDSLSLTKMEPVIIKSRDNLDLVSYLTLPNSVQKVNGRVKTPVPLVLIVHGGPNARDEWGYDSEHQWLSNRGYAVLSVNFRGSTGFGKQFINAGNGEWGEKMHDDLIDAVEWAIKEGITTRDKIAIMGGSYGGYAALIGLTKTPDVFAAGIDIVGPSSLETLLKSIPPYWKPYYSSLKIKIGGDPETEKGKQFLASRSPLTFANNIKKPLLIEQGANDPRVKQAESEQIVQTLQTKGIPVTYLLYPDEGHGFQRPENRMSSIAVGEAFLAQHLGGQFEPITRDFENSSIQIKVGKEHIGILGK